MKIDKDFSFNLCNRRSMLKSLVLQQQSLFIVKEKISVHDKLMFIFGQSNLNDGAVKN
jgi:hypothetical protein